MDANYHSDEINVYVKDVVSPDASAKDFRTWHAVAHAVKEVSQYLGNTPAVCRASYIDPRVIHRFEHGATIPLSRRIAEAELHPEELVHGTIEKAVLKLLRE
jgi:DNA topoisomerase I